MSVIHQSIRSACVLALLVASLATTWAADKKIILIAGIPSHGPLDHEFNAGCLLLKKCLDGVPGIKAEVHHNGWPTDDRALDSADAIFIYADGGGGHPAIQGNRRALISKLLKKGIGFGCGHFGVEVPKDNGGPEFTEWIGGYYEGGFSVNPFWQPNFNAFPNHPVSRGVKPFQVTDEWYFNLRFRPDGRGITPILVAKPADAVRKGPYVYPKGPYEHIIAASGRAETMMWVFEREDGGRSLGFTGGHRHLNWGDENFRKVVLNGLVWIAKADVPEGGIQSKVSQEELMQNLDPKTPTKPKPTAPPPPGIP